MNPLLVGALIEDLDIADLHVRDAARTKIATPSSPGAQTAVR